MPSIPQSLLWISLVVLWLFVLVPMLINKRDTVKRTSDVALSTRVLNGGVRSRLLRRRAPAAGHRHDPDWRGEADLEDDVAGLDGEDYEEAVTAAMYEASVAASGGAGTQMMVIASNSDANTEPVYIDVDVVEEDSGALPVGAVTHEDAVPGVGVQETLFAETGEPAPEADPVGDPFAADETAAQWPQRVVWMGLEYRYMPPVTTNTNTSTTVRVWKKRIRRTPTASPPWCRVPVAVAAWSPPTPPQSLRASTASASGC